MKTELENLIEDALEILDHAELISIEGGFVQGPSCPLPSPWNPNPFNPDWGGALPRNPIIAIILCNGADS
jgi:hypothetical protein